MKLLHGVARAHDLGESLQSVQDGKTAHLCHSERDAAGVWTTTAAQRPGVDGSDMTTASVEKRLCNLYRRTSVLGYCPQMVTGSNM